MNEIITVAKREIIKLKKILSEVDEFMNTAPEGCLKWQNKNGKTYYYHQFKDKENQWGREYIKRENVSLANELALKNYYSIIRPKAKKQLNELEKFVKRYSYDNLDDVYDNLCPERKALCTPISMSVETQLRLWQEEEYELARMHLENLRYETEQGEMVRSKSELIIANILYQNRKDILYKYERPLEIVCDGQKKIIFPDFTTINIHTGKIKYWEHAGRMDDIHYSCDTVKKMNNYVSNGLLPGRDVVWTFETQGYPLDVSVVKKMVKDVLIQP